MKKALSYLLIGAACFLFSCKKKDNPAPTGLFSVNVVTTPVTNITATTATGGGTVSSSGPLSYVGIMWDTDTTFGTGTETTQEGAAGTFISSMTGLASGATYYVRAYATTLSNTNIYYGNIIQFTTNYTPGKYTVTTLAGTGAAGAMDGDTAGATFNGPLGVAVDLAGNVYVADGTNKKIRKINTSGVVSTLAVTDGNPQDVVVDSLGNVYVAESTGKILKITPSGAVSTFAGSGSAGLTDGTGTSASFFGPVVLDIDDSSNIYVGDNKAFRKITPAAVVTTLITHFTTNFAIAVDHEFNLYESNQLLIDKIDNTGVVSSLAGSVAGFADGTGSAAKFSGITELRADQAGNIYVADPLNRRIRMITPAGVVTTLAGNGASGSVNGNSAIATFASPIGLAIDKAGNIYVADAANNNIRKISPL
jgi:serine/threonine protein kinase, bacterial